jgi:hypothetical protein
MPRAASTRRARTLRGLPGRERGGGHRAEDRERDRYDAVETFDAQDFLDQIGLGFQRQRTLSRGGGVIGGQIGRLIERAAAGEAHRRDIVAPGGHIDRDPCRIPCCDGEAEGGEDFDRAIGGDVGTGEARQTVEPQARLPLPRRSGACLGDCRGGAAADGDDHGGRGIEGGGQQGGVDPALEALPCVGEYSSALAGERDCDAVEQGAFDEDIGG